MKRLIIIISLPLIVFLILAFSVVESYTLRNSSAEVNRLEGLYIFTDSKPLKDYDYLGTVKVTIAFDTQYNGVRNGLIRKAKNSYPEADGVILTLKAGGQDRADVIKFKE